MQEAGKAARPRACGRRENDRLTKGRKTAAAILPPAAGKGASARLYSRNR